VSVGFSFVTQGTRHAELTLQEIGGRALNARPAFEEIYLTALDIIDENFDTEGGRGGQEQWAALTLSTIIWKQKRGLDPRILRATGELHESMTTYRHPLQYSRIERSKIVLAPRLLRGKLHQKGYGVPYAHGFSGFGVSEVPARPFVRFTDSDAKAFAREILRFVARGT
jgi:phage gpG-like protein